MEKLKNFGEQDLLPAESIQKHLIPWYTKNQRQLPWRALPDRVPNPYHVWLSEIMLQQTTVPAVIPYFLRFTALWPTLQDLSQASLDDILHAWQGLGYYARARNLFKCAQEIVQNHKGYFPPSESMLRQLPGIGPYTAGAIASIAFGQKASPVDANIERVLSRLYTIRTPLPTSKVVLQEIARHHTPSDVPGDYAQALMDLGSMICTPKKPLCLECPLQSICRAWDTKDQELFPYKVSRALKPTRTLNAFWICDEEENLLLEKRPPSGLLGGLAMVPIPFLNASEMPRDFFLECSPEPLEGLVSHTFTHFHLAIRVLKTSVKREEFFLSKDQFWCKMEDLSKQAFPTLMKKIIKRVEKNHKN